jgi:rhodanese-related sulfurtransferase
MKRISAKDVTRLLQGEGELALLDVREQGVHYRGHPFFACSAPLSRLELMAHDLVPRRAAPVVVLDGGGEGLAQKAGERLAAMGYTDVALLEGGCAGWRAAGGELFSGVNVPSKAFGEFVEHLYDTPRIAPEELKRWLEEGRNVVVLDSRPYEEYHRMNIPGGIDTPGAELAWRVHDLAPDPDTVVVVNCAGRTRSIIGCQSLRNAGIPNRVVALKDGTMGWDLAGFECEPTQGASGCRTRRRAVSSPVHNGCRNRRMAEGRGADALSPRCAYARGVRSRARCRLAACAGWPARPGERRVHGGTQRAHRAHRSRASTGGDDRVVAAADGLERGLRAP